MNNRRGSGIIAAFLLVTLLIIVVPRLLKAYLEYTFSGGAGVIINISPDKKIKLLVKTPFSRDPLPELYYQSTRLFAPPSQEIIPYDFGFSYDLYRLDDYVWSEDSTVFFAWKGSVPACAYNFADPTNKFTYLDPYYSKFNLDRADPQQLVHYLTTQQRGYLGGFLRLAAANGDTAVLEQLNKEGVSLNLLSGESPDYSPLGMALINKQTETVKFLLSKGALLNVGDRWIPSIAEDFITLLSYGYNINQQDKDGWTPLMYASTTYNSDFVKYLLSHGADCKKTNSDEKTALDIAREYHQDKMIRILTNRCEEHK